MDSGPPCKICTHDQRDAIERAMIMGKADSAIAKDYGCSGQTIGKHRRTCIPETLARARHAADVRRGDWLIEESRFLYGKARGVIDKAEAEESAEIKRLTRGMKATDREKVIRVAEAMAGSRAEVLAAIRTAKPVLELLGRLVGQLGENAVVNIHQAPDFQELREALLGALQPYPEARLDVADAMLEFAARREDGLAEPLH